MGITDTEKIDLGGLYYLYTTGFFSFILFIFLFTWSKWRFELLNYTSLEIDAW